MRVTPQVLGFALLLGNLGCTQAFVEVRHDRPDRFYAKPHNTLSVGARWFFWDAYGEWLADKMEAKARELALRDAWRKQEAP